MGEWKESTLGDVSIDGGHYGIAASAVPVDASLPTYLRITDIRDDGTINKSGLTSVDDPNSVEYILSPNDLVIARTGASTGRNYFYDGRDGELVYAGFLIKFSIDPNKIYPQYVKYWFLSPFYKAWLNSHTDGSTRANINAVTLADCPIRFPADLPTQRRIAAVLGALDDKIEVNRKICENLEAQAQALFKAWFVDFEPFGGKRPEGWKMMPVEELTERMASGGTPKTKIESYYDGTTKWFSTKELKDCFLFDSEKHISKEAVENSAAKVFPRDTVLMAIYAAPTVGRLGIMDEEGTFNQAAVGMVAKKYVGYPFLFLTLLAEREGLNLMAVGSCQQNLNVGVVKSYKVLLPDEKVLSRFNESIMPMFDEIRTLSKESRALAAMRDALLPKLMSGELAVEKVEG